MALMDITENGQSVKNPNRSHNKRIVIVSDKTRDMAEALYDKMSDYSMSAQGNHRDHCINEVLIPWIKADGERIAELENANVKLLNSGADVYLRVSAKKLMENLTLARGVIVKLEVENEKLKNLNSQ